MRFVTATETARAIKHCLRGAVLMKTRYAMLPSGPFARKGKGGRRGTLAGIFPMVIAVGRVR